MFIHITKLICLFVGSIIYLDIKRDIEKDAWRKKTLAVLQLLVRVTL